MAGQVAKSIKPLTGTTIATHSFRLSKCTSERIRQQLELQLLRDEVKISTKLHSLGFRRSSSTSGLDTTAQRTLTDIVRGQGLNVTSTARLIRGEFESDSRPNKALRPEIAYELLEGYEHRDLLIEIMQDGKKPKWLRKPPKVRFHRNHKSCQAHLSAVLRSIRDGQNTGRYMIVDDSLLDEWKNVVCSPLGAVEKKDIDPAIEVRLIHDLSFPKDASTNSSFDKSCAPSISYLYVVYIADRIEDLARRYPHLVIRMLKGDVKGAYRHLMMACEHVNWMAAMIPEQHALLIDLSAPFGWSGSAPFYAVFGRAITWLVQHNAPTSVSDSQNEEPFWGFEWVDDHLLIEPDRDDRLQLAEATLRHAMLALLGPRSINEEKFSTWSTRLNALGLTWDTVERTVSMPTDKITKALGRVRNLKSSTRTTKSEMMKLMGSLRHVCSCLRTARPFYQRLQALCNKASRFGSTPISAGARADLEWFDYILSDGHLQDLPLSIFGSRPPRSHLHLYKDASNLRLAVLNPSVNEYIQIRYDPEEIAWITNSSSKSQFSINVREHLCIALALWVWGPSWKTTHRGATTFVQCWSDNRSAVAWSNSLSSSNEMSQEINRAIGLAEAIYNIRVQASHLPGASNIAADAASRAWSSPFSETWTNFPSVWQQVPVQTSLRKLYQNFSKTYKPNLWPGRHAPSTNQHGYNGQLGVTCSSSRRGSLRNPLSIPTSSLYSEYIAGNLDGTSVNKETVLRRSSPRSVTLRGIIVGSSATPSDSQTATSSQSTACVGKARVPHENHQSRSPCCASCTSHSTSANPATALYGGLWSWGFSFFSGDLNISPMAGKSTNLIESSGYFIPDRNWEPRYQS